MKNLILPATFFVFNFFSIAQKAPSTKNDVEFRVYKEYDKKGNLIRYDSTRVEKGHKMVPNISIYRKDSVMEIPNHFLHFKRDLQEKNLDSILDQHFNRMEKLFEQFFEQNDQAKRKRSTR